MARETPLSVGEFFGPLLGIDSMSPLDAIKGQCLKLVREAIELSIEAGASPAELERATHTPTRSNGDNPHTDWHESRMDRARFRKEFGDCETVMKMIEYVSGAIADDECDSVMTGNRSRTWKKTPEGNLQHTK